MRVFKPQATKPIPDGARVNKAKGTVTYSGRGGKTRRAVLTENGRMRVECDTFHVKFKDHLDRDQRVVAYTDEGQSRLLGAQITNLITYHGQPLPADLRDYFEKTPSRISKALREMDLLPDSDDHPQDQPLSEWIDRFEVWLSTSKSKSGYKRNRTHISVTMTRIRNICTGCAFETWKDVTPSKVETFIGNLNIEPSTHNGYIVAIKHFGQWLRREGLIEANILADLSRIKPSDRETRRPLEAVEVKPLLEATLARGRRRNIDPMDRAALYVVGLVTGFRRNELSWLTPECFDLDRAVVRLDGAHTKDHRDAIQPIPISLIDGLRTFLADKEPGKRIWHPITHKSATMIRMDRKAAGLRIADSEGRELCFHSLRHSLRSWLVRAKVVEAVIDDILRHKPPTNNTGRRHYTHLTDEDRRSAIESLPVIPWPGDLVVRDADNGTTGGETEDVTCESLPEVCFQVSANEQTCAHMMQGTVDNGSKTALLSQKQGLDRTFGPMPSFSVVLPTADRQPLTIRGR